MPNKVRVNQAIFTLTNQRNALVTLAADGSDLDTYARMVSEAFLQTALSGIPQTGTGHIHGDIDVFDAIATKIKGLVIRWMKRALRTRRSWRDIRRLPRTKTGSRCCRRPKGYRLQYHHAAGGGSTVYKGSAETPKAG